MTFQELTALMPETCTAPNLSSGLRQYQKTREAVSWLPVVVEEQILFCPDKKSLFPKEKKKTLSFKSAEGREGTKYVSLDM